MKDLIDRQAAIDALRYAQHRFTVADEAGGMGTVKWSEDVIYFAAAERALTDLPSAQPERKTGRWIDETLKPWGLVHHPYKCSQCGEHSEMDSDFCPNCGAKMEESDG